MGTIKMTLRVGDGKNGNKAELSGFFRGRGRYSVNWGDGNIETVSHKRKYLKLKHIYPIEATTDNRTFEVTISTERDNLYFFVANAGYMKIEALDLSECQELEILSIWDMIESLDITTNPNIKDILARGGSVKYLDFSKSSELEKLELKEGDIQCLDLTHCSKLSSIIIEDIKGLELLDLSCCPRLSQIRLFKNPHLTDVFLHEKCRLVNFHLVGDFTEDTKDRIRAAWDNYKYTGLEWYYFRM